MMEHWQEIVSRFQQSAPVDISAMAEALGINVWEDSDLPEGVSGKLFEDHWNGGAKGFSIAVRASDAYVRRRFTVAHEIAHFLLHRNRIGSAIVDDQWYRSNLSNREEVEANRFAADLLMPRPLLAEAIRNYGSDPVTLARLFAVSEAAMRIRLGLPAYAMAAY